MRLCPKQPTDTFLATLRYRKNHLSATLNPHEPGLLFHNNISLHSKSTKTFSLSYKSDSQTLVSIRFSWGDYFKCQFLGPTLRNSDPESLRRVQKYTFFFFSSTLGNSDVGCIQDYILRNYV